MAAIFRRARPDAMVNEDYASIIRGEELRRLRNNVKHRHVTITTRVSGEKFDSFVLEIGPTTNEDNEPNHYSKHDVEILCLGLFVEMSDEHKIEINSPGCGYDYARPAKLLKKFLLSDIIINLSKEYGPSGRYGPIPKNDKPDAMQVHRRKGEIQGSIAHWCEGQDAFHFMLKSDEDLICYRKYILGYIVDGKQKERLNLAAEEKVIKQARSYGCRAAIVAIFVGPILYVTGIEYFGVTVAISLVTAILSGASVFFIYKWYNKRNYVGPITIPTLSIQNEVGRIV